MGRERGRRMVQQPLDGRRRHALKAEDLGERTVAYRTALLRREGGFTVGHVAYGRHAVAPHPRIGRRDRPLPLHVVEAAALRPHPLRESREAAPEGMAPRRQESSRWQCALTMPGSRMPAWNSTPACRSGSRHVSMPTIVPSSASVSSGRGRSPEGVSR